MRNWIFWGFLAVAAFFLLTEHRAHARQAVPYLLLLACPLPHLFHRHGSHEGHERWPTLVTRAMYPVLVATYALLARREEAEMFAQFGDEYRRYRAAVPAFVPRIGGPAGPRHA